MRSTVVGGAMLPHAPQFFTMPETEDKKTVEQVRAVAADIGNKLKALKPDLWIIFSNDHAEQFDADGHGREPPRGRTSPGQRDRGHDVHHRGEGRKQIGERRLVELGGDLDRRA